MMPRLLKPSSYARLVNKNARRLAKNRAKRLKQEAEAFAWLSVRVALHARIGGACQRCDCKVYLNSRNPLAVMHSHHFVWRSRGGGDELSNQLGVCPQCHDLIHRHLVDVEGTAENPRFKDIPQ